MHPFAATAVVTGSSLTKCAAVASQVFFPDSFDGAQGWAVCLRMGPTAAVATGLVLGWEWQCQRGE